MSASIRLNQDHRAFLCSLAKSTVKCPAEDAADVAAYKAFHPMVRKLIEARFPARDMRVLQKYEVTTVRGKAKLQLAAGGVVEFAFREQHQMPMVPDRYEVRGAIYAADADVTAAYEAHAAAASAFKEAFAKKISDYHALVNASATLAEVEKVWPEAAALRDRVGRALPVILSDDIIARIQADAGLRAAA